MPRTRCAPPGYALRDPPGRPAGPTDPIALVAVASSHRGDAFAACEFIMDYLKTQAPFWKKEVTPEGEKWVDAQESDE